MDVHGLSFSLTIGQIPQFHKRPKGPHNTAAGFTQSKWSTREREKVPRTEATVSMTSSQKGHTVTSAALCPSLEVRHCTLLTHTGREGQLDTGDGGHRELPWRLPPYIPVICIWSLPSCSYRCRYRNSHTAGGLYIWFAWNSPSLCLLSWSNVCILPQVSQLG